MQTHPLVDVSSLSENTQANPIQTHLVYATRENFTGYRVEGYDANTHICLLTPKAAQALLAVANDLSQQGFTLYVYDAYRPRRAVLFFKKWSKEAPHDPYELARKKIHYPTMSKSDLFEKGYLSENSQHSYGNTVDVVLADFETHNPVDMGAPFDYLGELSHHDTLPPTISTVAYNYRQRLKIAMEKQGFIAYNKEFWHYSFREVEVSEPLDIPITAALRDAKNVKMEP